jgi:hypothetical protein
VSTLVLIEKHNRQQAIRRQVEQRIAHSFVHKPPSAAVSLEPLHLVGHSHEAATPRLDANELRTLADVG